MNYASTQAPVALVTGAGRRIGAAIAKHLHQAGFDVIIHCNQSQAAASALAKDLNHQRANSSLVLSHDLSLKDAAGELIVKTMAWKNRLNLLVNNASLFTRTDFTHFDDAAWDLLFNVNVNAPFQLSHAAYPHLAVQQGAIINITDIHANKPLKGYAIYCQSKAALVMQTKALAREFAPLVRVNAVAPGAIAWPEHDNALTTSVRQKIIADTPLKKHGETIYIAQAVLALAENNFITGEILHVDGGRGLV